MGGTFPSEHLQAIIARPQLAAGLQKLVLGDSDTGYGAYLSDAVVQTLVAATPNLRVLSLDACTQLSDTTLIVILTHCPLLERLAITGNDKVRGRLSGKGLKDLKAQPTIGLALKELVLYDQYVPEKECKALTKARKGLAVKTGESTG